MKRMLSLLLSVLMLTGVATAVPVSANSGWEAHEDVDLRVGVLTDTHMRNADTTSTMVNQILDAQAAIGGGKIDGMALVGDVTYYNATDDCTDRRHYRNMYASIEEKMPGAEIIYAMGNHEFPHGKTDAETAKKAHTAFVEGTGQALNTHKVIGDDYHFIAVAPENASSLLSEETKSWAMQEIENAIGSDSTNGVQDENGNYSFPDNEVPDSTKPVFVLVHVPLPGTVLYGSEGGDVKEFVSYLKTRPQVVVLNGHLHVSALVPSTIWQGGFTAFQGSVNDGIYISDRAFTEEYTGADAQIHQGAMIEVDDNVVKIYKLDYDNQEEIGTPWIVDVPQIVSNLRDDNPDNDQDAYLYTEAKRAQADSAAQFPEGTELVAKPLETGLMVQYPNTAYMSKYDEIQQDNFIRGYKVEAVDEEGYVAASLSHQADYYLKPEKRKASYTKELVGLESGKTYTVNVYPMMPLGTYGTLGTPISATVTMPEDYSKDDAIRYEIEDYCPQSRLNKVSMDASGGGICISAQGGVVDGVAVLGRPADDVSPFTFDFEVELPVDGEYKIEYGAGYRTSHNLSKVTFTLDDNIVIGDNMQRGDVDRSLGNTYPWDNLMPLYTYYADNQTLSAGKHTVTVTVDLPVAPDKKQPYLFCADYIEFTPKTVMVGLNGKERIEFEDYVSEISIAETDNTPAGAIAKNALACSNGAYMMIDTADKLAANDTETFSIPVHIKQEGYYKMRYVECKGISPMDIYLDSVENTPINSGFSTVSFTDQDESGKYIYFESTWAIARECSGMVHLPEGNHELIVKLTRRKSFGDYAALLDYLEFVPATRLIEKNQETILEFENYKDDFTPTKPEVRLYDAAHGGAFAANGSAGTKTVTLEIPVYVAESGVYHVDASIGQAEQLSLVTLLKNGEEELYAFNLENAKGILFKETHYVLREYKFPLELEKGLQTLTFSMAPRNGWNGTVAYALDYFRIGPDVDGVVEEGTVTTIEFEDVVKKIDKIEQSDGSVIVNKNGTNYVPAVRNSVNASGGKFAELDTPDGQGVDAYYDIYVGIDVKTAGRYRMNYVVCGNLGTPGVFLDADSKSIAVAKIATDDSKNEDGLLSYFGSTWANAGIYEGTVYLPEGFHTVMFRTKLRGGNFLDYAQHFDYVEFSPVESFSVANGTANVTTVTNRPVSGTAILALYNGTQMVGVGSVPMENEKLITISVPVSETVTSAKVMTWSDFENAKPAEKEKIFELK